MSRFFHEAPASALPNLGRVLLFLVICACCVFAQADDEVAAAKDDTAEVEDATAEGKAEAKEDDAESTDGKADSGEDDPAAEEAAEAVPMLEQEPFDRITLDSANDDAVLEVFPLDFPGRKIPKKPKPTAKVKMRLLKSPDTTYEVRWHNIEKIELFEGMVLAEALEVVKSGKLDAAYDYFLYLSENHPGTEGLDAGMRTYLYEEAKAAHFAGMFDRALAMLREIHDKEPDRAGLGKALGVTTDKLVEKYVAAEDYDSARSLLGDLARRFPQEAAVTKWREKLQAMAAGLLDKAQAAEQDGDLPAASGLCRKLMRIHPELPGARQFAESLWKEYPHVTVGVTLSADDYQPSRLADWAARRSGRLLFRTLTEFSGPGSECGTYECPVGSIDVDQISGRVTVQVQPGIHWSQGTATLTGSDVSRRLLAMADPSDAAYKGDWAELLDALAVRDVYRVDVDLKRVHVRPEALLQTKLIPYTDPELSRQPLLSNGPFVVFSQGENAKGGPSSPAETVYRANRQYFAAGPTQPQEICERPYERGADALRALQMGTIQVLDRVNPWDLKTVSSDESLTVAPYAVPSVHCLIPNMRKAPCSKRTFRRALVYAINRGAILRQLFKGDVPQGCRQLSGPFPIGLSDDDPMAYAYDDEVEPRKYEPRLAVALASVAIRELTAAEAKKGRKFEQSSLVLAHPADELSRIACGSIAEYLKLVGLKVELRELSDGIPAEVPDDIDLMYAQLAVWEPLVDARRLLGEKGPGGGCSPYMSLALRELETSKEFHSVLWKIHRLANQDVAILPLWQMTDHFAYRKSISGMGRLPVTLYGNVERWQVTLEYPQEVVNE